MDQEFSNKIFGFYGPEIKTKTGNNNGWKSYICIMD